MTRASHRGRNVKFFMCVTMQQHRGIEGDRQNRRNDHRKILGVRQRLEQSAFLRFQGQNRQERHRDNQQRKKTRAAHLLYRVNHHAVVILLPPRTLPLFQLLVDLLHDYDRRIHHRTDCDGNASERHDV